MKTSDVVLLVLSVLLLGVVFMTNRNKRYGVITKKKEPGEETSEYALKKKPPTQ